MLHLPTDISSSDRASLASSEGDHEKHPTVTEQSIDPSVESHRSPGNGPAPDGGFKAWLQVAGGFVLWFNTWGVINEFGAYQTHYESPQSAFVQTPSAISWIGTLQAFLLQLVCAVGGPLYDAGYSRHLIISGTILTTFSNMMIGLCQAYWQAVLAQGICMGIGLGFLFIPSVGIISTYFHKRVSTAIGLASSGGGLGGVLYPIIFHRLLPRIGFGWTTRTIGFISLATLILPCIVMEPRCTPKGKRALFDFSAFREVPYDVYLLGGFIGFLGFFAPLYYLQYYAITKHITNESMGFYLLATMQTGAVFGRIIPNMIADHVGPWNVLISCMTGMAIVTISLIGAHDVASVIVLSILFGFFSGAYVAIIAAVVVKMTKDHTRIGTRLGMCYALTGIGALISGPIAGAILTYGSWADVWVFGGVSMFSSAALFVVGRLFVTKGKLWAKA